MKRWITFDLDGTLMQNPFGKWIFPEVEALVCAGLSEPYEVRKALVREHEARMDRNETVAAYDWDEMLRQLLEQLNLKLEIDIEQLVLKHSIQPKIYLLEDSILATLEKLKSKGYSLAVATNGFYKYQYPVMKELGLAEWFDEIITPEKVGCGKPNTGMVRELLQSGELVAHVGDRLDHDVYLANRLGVPSMFIYRDLPEALRKLPIEQRSADPEFIAICENKLKAENSSLTAVPLPPDYVATHVLYRLEELLECV